LAFARAGKVKAQTPKVDPTPKPKEVTGRAKKRQLYNKRFVNAVVSGGAKVKPNQAKANVGRAI